MILWPAFLLGLLGGVHCAGMCGPLMLALPRHPGGPARFVAGRVTYQLGRVFTYCLLGIGFGVIGHGFALVGVQRFASVVLGVALLSGLAVSRGKFLAARVAGPVNRLKQAMGKLLARPSFPSQAMLGALNGLLPCGLVYVAGAGAAVAGSVPAAIEFMALFGLGTLPVMLGISLTGHLVPATMRFRLARLVPAGVVVIAALLILRGLSLGIPYVSPDLSNGSGAACACYAR